MTSLMGWLFGSDAIPTGTLVWATGGMGFAVVLTVLLLVTVGLIATQRERRSEKSSAPAKAPWGKQPVVAKSLPSAA